jgi:pimeloyl-ACP methyl ester carboxylesterase
MKLAATILSATILVGAAASPAFAATRSCADMAKASLPGFDLQISKAQAVAAAAAGTVRLSPISPPIPVAMPAYCLVEGSFERRTGAGGKPYAIGFALALPQNWNGRFLFQGGGGLNGTVNPPFGAQAVGAAPALARGFAVVSTDSGHKGAVFEASFQQDQLAALNFAEASVGKVTRLGKQLTTAYYGSPIRYSYFDGCSTGGREAMLAAQRYPEEFDGVIAGDPAMETGYSNIALAWAAVSFNRAAPKDASGKPVAGDLFSKSDKQLLISRLLSDCDELDGRKDGLIFNPGACRFDPAELKCAGAKSDACLSGEQIDALKAAFAGPRTAGGAQVYPGFPWDTGVASEQGIGGLIPSHAPSPLGPPNLAMSLDVDTAAVSVRADGMQVLTDTASWTNLSAFYGHGGKIVFYHGLSDPWFSPEDTLAYYRKAADKAQASSRMFLVPGMGHCLGGSATLDQFDMLSAVVDWVENHKAPDAVIATGASLPGQSRPLCAWPAHAQYSGSGDPALAASYACRREP